MSRDFFSNFGIGDEVEFIPRFKQSQEMGIAQEYIDGKIVAVRFTEAKVFYDVYSPYWGEVFRDVQSNNVKKEEVVRTPVPQ